MKHDQVVRRVPRALLTTLAIIVVSGGCQSAASPSAPTSSAPSTLPSLPSFRPDEPLILTGNLAGDGGGGILVMRPDGTDVQQLGSDALPGVHKRGDWSPDGQRVVFIDDTSGRMWIAHLDGSPTESVPACDTPGCDYPAWSPDGTRIAFSRSEEADGVTGPPAVGIYVVELATGKVSKVVRLERPLLADVPRWSPDGTRLVFQVDRMDDDAYETGAAIAVVPVTGGDPHYLTTFDQFASAPDWGWVTDEIVYSTELIGLKQASEPGDETWDLYAIKPDGSGARRITNVADGQRLLGPRWTPDGMSLTAKEFDEGPGGGRLVNPNTGEVKPFVTSVQQLRPLVRPILVGS